MKIHYIYYHPIKDELKIIKEGTSYLSLIFTTFVPKPSESKRIGDIM